MLLFLPHMASAAVSISEVTWMGSANSANHEWIELHNDGEAVDITGWTITDGMNLEISLSGSVPAGQYVVLERTSDESAPGAAFLIYTGALVNTGATLTLRRVDGTTADQVSGGENWEKIGGDNVTKETAQYTSSGWVTAVATPGRGITTSEVDVAAAENQFAAQPAETVSGSIKAAKPVKSGESVRLEVPDVTLKLLVDAQTVGYVNQPIHFSVAATGIGKDLINSLAYEWNFGDGFTSSNKNPEHVFKYPGKYVVTVYASFKRQEQVTRHEITILPVLVSLTMNNIGDVQINNDSPYEIDLSGYKVRGEKLFTFPARTILLPSQTITVPYTKLGKTTNRLVSMYDTEEKLVASLIPSVLLGSQTEDIATSNQQPAISPVSFSEREVVSQPEFSFALPPEDTLAKEVISDENTEQTKIPKPATQPASVGSQPIEKSSSWPYFALIAILAVGTIGVYLVPRRNEIDQ